MDEHDQAAAGFKAKFMANYGTGPFPWQAILAALMAMLGGCPLPTAANLKKQIHRPLMQARLFLRLLATGVPARTASQAIAATAATVTAATDEEIDSWVSAASESE